MKKALKFVLAGCLSIVTLLIILFIIIFYPLIFPDSPEEIEKKKVEIKMKSIAKIKNKTIDDYIKDFDLKPNTRNSNFDDLTTQFSNQKHRFAFNKCEFSYNDEKFYLNDSIGKIISLFGKADNISKTITYKYPKGEIRFYERTFTDYDPFNGKKDKFENKVSLRIFDYTEIEKYGSLIISKELENNEINVQKLKEINEREFKVLKEKHEDSLIKTSEEIRLSYDTLKIDSYFLKYKNTKQYLLTEFNIDLKPIRYYPDPDTPFKIIMFREIPYKLSTEIYDFLDLSSLTRDDLDYHRIHIYQNECIPSDDVIVYTKVESEPYFGYKSLGGHLGVRGPYDPEKSKQIEYINFSLQSLESLQKSEMTKAGLLD